MLTFHILSDPIALLNSWKRPSIFLSHANSPPKNLGYNILCSSSKLLRWFQFLLSFFARSTKDTTYTRCLKQSTPFCLNKGKK